MLIDARHLVSDTNLISLKWRQKMMKIFSFAGMIEVLLVVIEAIGFHEKLPLGGSHIAQLGIIFGFAFVIVEIITIAKKYTTN